MNLYLLLGTNIISCVHFVEQLENLHLLSDMEVYDNDCYDIITSSAAHSFSKIPSLVLLYIYICGYGSICQPKTRTDGLP